ncbi:hypothetical protein DPX39_040046900 [Trypanosoma brucei equiperdum]|uniref:Uncharacterized protein n=1 Tax=Trypanosoma brucei equiperdum TaxID=630700 RepID=A0A3L6L8H1_9TRYP|nr:hypothetical protein DPX39_040046900 [Trypanosoma brucei equiperdum]
MRKSFLGARFSPLVVWNTSYRFTSSTNPGPNQPVTGSANPTATTPKAVGKDEEKEEYSIPTAEILDAVRRRDFSAVQSHAVGIAQHKWKEEHNIPAACVVLTLFTWFFASGCRRRAERACRATEARVEEEAEQMLELVNTLIRKWRQNVQRAEQQLQLILDKNGELTKDIDRMTSGLRQCYVDTRAAAK